MNVEGDPWPDTDVVLQVEDLTVEFPPDAGVVNAVRGVSFELRRGECLGIVGESGSGESVSSLAVMGLLPATAKITGSARVLGREVLGLEDADISSTRLLPSNVFLPVTISCTVPDFDADRLVDPRSTLMHDRFTQLALVLQRTNRRPGFLKHELELGHLLRDVVDNRLLLAQGFEVDPHVFEEMDDRIGLGVHLVDELPAGVDRTDARFRNDDRHRGPARIELARNAQLPAASNRHPLCLKDGHQTHRVPYLCPNSGDHGG